MRVVAISWIIWLGSSVAMMVLGLAGIASAVISTVSPVAVRVPEIDPATAVSGLALLGGGALLLLERRRIRRR